MADFDDVVRRRRSVRAFLPDPIPQDTLQRIFGLAALSPSNCNVQPWVVHVASGKMLDDLRGALLAEAQAGQFQPDIPAVAQYEGEYRARRIASAKALFEATGVDRHDMDARRASLLRNFIMFEAPHAAFIFMPRNFGIREACDVGMYAQTLMLALTAEGLGSCPQGALSHHPYLVRNMLGISQDLVCLFGISFGFPDDQHPSSAARTDRAIDETTLVFHS